ncbi:UbiA family prenyltransferase [Streptomyces sp. bgisy027]|uniref:UbiA family prenyltransferase n=1 Tax=Streptomyces sp. bgisy027 TaxID=3413770 RepID=UPI003D756251
MSTLRDWAELLRISALFTVPGDVVARATSAGEQVDWRAVRAIGCSLCLYEAGMALNDFTDRGEGARERPHRPLPSGRIWPRAALAAAVGLTGAGLVLGATAGRSAATVAGALAATVWAYDLKLKHTSAGPPAMGAARGLDLLLGAAAVGGRLRHPAVSGSTRTPPTSSYAPSIATSTPNTRSTSGYALRPRPRLRGLVRVRTARRPWPRPGPDGPAATPPLRTQSAGTTREGGTAPTARETGPASASSSLQCNELATRQDSRGPPRSGNTRMSDRLVPVRSPMARTGTREEVNRRGHEASHTAWPPMANSRAAPIMATTSRLSDRRGWLLSTIGRRVTSPRRSHGALPAQLLRRASPRRQRTEWQAKTLRRGSPSDRTVMARTMCWKEEQCEQSELAESCP